MVAIVEVRERNGTSPGTPTIKTGQTVRFKTADNATVDTNDPLQIPASGQNYSMEKNLQMFIGATGPDTNITNLKYYLDGAKGWQAQVKLWGRIVPSYTTPGIPSNANDPPQMPVNGTPVAATDSFLWTQGAPADLGAGPFTGTNTDIGSLVLQTMEVETGATQGTLATETATFEYDEL